jgi:RND family efflux transporter MFP subunit
MKDLKTNLFRLLFIFPIILTACGTGNDQSAADLTMPVVVEKIKAGTIADYVSTTGTLKAIQEEAVVSEVDGILQLLQSNGTIFGSGQRVVKGQLLAKLHNPSYLLDIRVESKELAMANAQRELEKQEVLFKEGGVTEKELETARQTALDARLNFESAQLQAEKLNLRAPGSGFVTNLLANYDGTRVSAGFQLCRVMDYTRVITLVNLPNSDLGKVRIGQKVNIQNYAIPDQVFVGSVITIDPAIDPQTRTFSVTIEVDNKALILRPGMFAKVDIIVEEHDGAVVIPKYALQTRDGRPVAFVVEGVSAQMRELSTGIATKEDIEVVSGLAEGERLVVKGQETLRDKSKVRITE